MPRACGLVPRRAGSRRRVTRTHGGTTPGGRAPGLAPGWRSSRAGMRARDGSVRAGPGQETSPARVGERPGPEKRGVHEHGSAPRLPSAPPHRSTGGTPAPAGLRRPGLRPAPLDSVGHRVRLGHRRPGRSGGSFPSCRAAAACVASAGFRGGRGRHRGPVAPPVGHRVGHWHRRPDPSTDPTAPRHGARTGRRPPAPGGSFPPCRAAAPCVAPAGVRCGRGRSRDPVGHRLRFRHRGVPPGVGRRDPRPTALYSRTDAPGLRRLRSHPAPVPAPPPRRPPTRRTATGRTPAARFGPFSGRAAVGGA